MVLMVTHLPSLIQHSNNALILYIPLLFFIIVSDFKNKGMLVDLKGRRDYRVQGGEKCRQTSTYFFDYSNCLWFLVGRFKLSYHDLVSAALIGYSAG